MVEKTLKAMRLGGIYDHLGFGFHRYATDAKWFIPHFEKMLYDQAMLITAYTEAYQATRKEEYKQTAREVIEYVMQNMTDPEGGFYSAEDADSEGEEGKFYLWSEQEIEQALPHDEAEVIKKIFSIEKQGNFAEAVTGEKTGKNILHLGKPLAELTSNLHLSLEKLQTLVDDARSKLLATRQKRAHPSKDDKILTDWNGLMIVAIAKASQVFNEPEFAAAAKKAADFIFGHLCESEGRLIHRYRKEEASIAGFLDDYAFFIWGLIELYEAIFETKYLGYAVNLTNKMLELFWDKEYGGFYQTSDCSETTLARNKETYDGAYPSGNSVAAWDLICLMEMTGEKRFAEKATQLMHAFSIEVLRTPFAHAQLMIALDFILGPTSEVAIVGDPQKEDTVKMLQALRSKFLPRNTIILHSRIEKNYKLTELAPFTKEMKDKEGKATAFVCRNHACNLPTTDVQTMLKLLEEK
jgi:uncharacterized protein YyaL (SSP411 family)